MALDTQDYNNNSEIKRLLSMKGTKRLEIGNNLTEYILNYNYSENTPGISLRFLETRKRSEELGDWDNYYVLFSALKYNDSIEYLDHIFKSISKIISDWSDKIEIDVIGLQEVDCSEVKYYYILIYILSNGRDKEIGERNTLFGGE